jgi:hypothetical protein
LMRIAKAPVVQIRSSELTVDLRRRPAQSEAR